MLNATKRFVRGINCGFALDDIRSWEFIESDKYTQVNFSNGTQSLFKEDLREAIVAALNTPVVSAAAPVGHWSNTTTPFRPLFEGQQP